MDYPQVGSHAYGNAGSPNTNHTVSLPSGVVAGNLLIAFIAGVYPSWIDTPGWTILSPRTQTDGAGPPWTTAMYRRATGSEGASVNVVCGTSGLIAWSIYRITGASPTIAPESQYRNPVINGGYGSVATPGYYLDPANWGTEETLWIACGAHTYDDAATVDSPYANLFSANATGIGIDTARYTSTVGWAGPATFRFSASYDWDVFTVGIVGAPDAPVISSVGAAFGWGVAANVNHGFGPTWGWGVSATLTSGYYFTSASSFGWGVSAEVSQGEVGKSHHLKLGNEYLMVRSNTYQKKRAPTFGARITTGDPDYNNLSIWQHWVQKCWVGGMGAEHWVDPEMFDSAVGIDTTTHEEMRLSRVLKKGLGSGWDLGGGSNISNHDFMVFGDKLYCLVTIAAPAVETPSGSGVFLRLIDAGHTVFGFSLTPGVAPSGHVDSVSSRLYVYNPVAESWTSVAMPGIEFSVNAMASFAGKLFLGGTDLGSASLYYASVPGTWTKIFNPAGSSDAITSLRVFNQRLYVPYGTQVWRLTNELVWDGNTVFYTANANSGSNYIAAMEPHLGYLYMLSQNGHLHRTDGNNTFDIWSWDGQTAGVSLKSYDNKLFVGTYEYTDTPDLGFGVLYQFTGAAVTELKRWGKVGKATSIGKMTVYGRRLYYGASGLFGEADGFGVAMYDSVTDGHSIYALQPDVSTYPDSSGVGNAWLVDAVFVFGGKLFAAVRGHGVFFTQDSFKDAQMGLAQYVSPSAGGEYNPSYGSGVFVSSLYDAGTPGLEKLWQKITVYCALPVSTSLLVSYSLDNGVNWILFPVETGPRTATEPLIFRLNNIRSTQFKLKMQLRTTDELQSPLIKGIVVAYLPQPEPNWLWTFTVPVSDKWQLMDGTEEIKNTEALIAYFERLFRNQEVIHFIDIDGVEWATVGPGVLIYDMVTTHFDVSDPREADLRMTILEVVESYA